MERTFDRSVLAGIGLVVAVFLVNAGLGIWNIQQLHEDAGWVAHTNEVLDQTGNVLLTLIEAETGQRGFLATGKDEFLETYHAALAGLSRRLAKLRVQVVDSGSQRERLLHLQEMTAAELALLKEGIDLRRSNADANRLLTVTKKAQERMDGIRGLVARMREQETKLLQERKRRSQTAYAAAVATQLLTTALGLAMVGAVVWLLRRSFRARMKASANLYDQREWFRTTLASIGDAVIATDAKGRVAFLNSVAHSLTGWTPQEAEQQPLENVFKIVNEQDRQPVENPAAKILREGFVVGLANHTVLIGKNGRETPIADCASPIRDQKGRAIGVVLVFRDVTETRRLERLQRDLQGQLELQVQEKTAELRATEERFRLLVEGSRDYAIFMLDPRGHIVSWNPGAERINGCQAHEIIGQHFSRFYTAEDIQRSRPERELQAAADQGTYEEEGWRVRKGGSKYWASVIVTALRDEAGNLRGFSKITRDLTAKKQAEENARRLLQELAARSAAERAEQTARFLADASATLATLVDDESTLQKVASLSVPFFADWCAVDMLGPDGTLRRLAVTHVDPAKVEIAHELHRRYPPDPSAPQGVWHILHTGQTEMVTHITDAMIAERVTDPERLRLLRALGLKSYIGVPLRARAKTLGVITFVTAESGRHFDATGQAVAEDLAGRAGIAVENAQLYQELREADRLKDEFLAMLAHELRNPLVPIRNSLHIMKQPGANGQILEQVREMAERQVQHMARLLDDLLDVSRISRGTIELRHEIVDVAPLVQRTAEAARPLMEERRHELTVSLPAGPVQVKGDPTRLDQVLTNLLNNAAKYTEPHGHIWLTVELQEGEVVWRVRDTGIGIAADMLPRIFDLFVQAERRLDRSQGGVGIGLTLVRRLVELHGGRVGASSSGPGQGSEFIVRLPAMTAEWSHAEPPTAQKKVADGDLPSHRVLIVDDNLDAADSLAMLLRLHGHDVHVAHDGPSALTVAQQHPPDLVFLDIGMPGLDGYAVCRQMRQQPQMARALLVALTGWGQEEDRKRSKEAGFDEHLVKPIEPAVLQGLLAGLSQRRS